MHSSRHVIVLDTHTVLYHSNKHIVGRGDPGTQNRDVLKPMPTTSQPGV